MSGQTRWRPSQVQAVIGAVVVLLLGVWVANQIWVRSDANQRKQVENNCSLAIAIHGGDYDDLTSKVMIDGVSTRIWYVTGGTIGGRPVICSVPWDIDDHEAGVAELITPGR